jgi:formamidopyrimidine-DNA glycosylase
MHEVPPAGYRSGVPELPDVEVYRRRLGTETRDGPHLRLHFGMTGDLVLVADEEDDPPFTRVAFHLSGRRRLLVADHGLGPDALDLDPRDLASLLRGSRAGLNGLLMDQSGVAGLGNIYSDEILFQARLDPRAPAARVGDAGVHRLHRQLHRVVDRAVQAGADPDDMPRGWLLHARDDGAPCPRGNGPIERFSLGGRHGFWCKACQRDRWS